MEVVTSLSTIGPIGIEDTVLQLYLLYAFRSIPFSRRISKPGTYLSPHTAQSPLITLILYFPWSSLNLVELNICLRTKGECFIITISLYDCSYSVLISVIFRRRNGDKSTFIFATACRQRREKLPPLL